MTVLMVTGVLDVETLNDVHGTLAGVSWRDGRATAGQIASRVKRNEQADLNTPEGEALRETLRDAVTGHSVIKAAARPRRVSPIMVSRTSYHGFYGPHIDNAMMGANEDRLRTDLSFTLFLSPPESYQGGELIIHGVSGTQVIKSDPGDLVLYPSSDIHEVAPVTQGERLVAVGWIESLIADPQQRALLFDLENLRVTLRARMPVDAPELLTLDKSIANLLRMWAVT